MRVVDDLAEARPKAKISTQMRRMALFAVAASERSIRDLPAEALFSVMLAMRSGASRALHSPMEVTRTEVNRMIAAAT